MGVEKTTMDIVVFSLVIGFFSLIAITLIVAIIIRLGKSKNEPIEYVENDENNENEASMSATNTDFFNAKVMSRRVALHYYGYIKAPRSQYTYLLTFETEEGEKLELPVPQEAFEKIKDGDT